MSIRQLIWSLSLLLVSGTALLAQSPTNKKGYHIRAKIEGYTNDTLILGYRLGSKTYVKDTCLSINKDAKGYFVFKRDTFLEGGVYIILTKPENTYFEFLVPNDAEQNLVLTTKPEGQDMTRNLKIEGSPDNQAFLDYVHFLGNLQRRKAEIDQKFNDADPDTKSKLEEEINNMNSKVEEYQKALIAKNPGYLSTKLVKASLQPIVPKEVEAMGQPYPYYYFKSHYFDDFDWSDKRLVRTPIMEQKIEFYLEKLTPQDPDSIIVGCDYIIGLAEKAKSKEVYQFVTAHLLNKYAQSKVICMDKVYVHIGSKYYCGAKKPDWIDQEQLEKICENVNDLRYSLCGMHAPQASLINIKTKLPVSLYSLPHRFVAVYF